MTANEEARRVADEQLIAYNAKDMVAFLDLFHEEATLVNLPGQTVIADGIQAIREMYEIRFKTPGLRCEVHHRSEIGNIAIDRETVHSNDNPSVDILAMYEVNNGKIVRVFFIRGGELPNN